LVNYVTVLNWKLYFRSFIDNNFSVEIPQAGKNCYSLSKNKRIFSGRLLSAMKATNEFTNTCNYVLTSFFHILDMDFHSDYFKVESCVNIIYRLALKGRKCFDDEIKENSEWAKPRIAYIIHPEYEQLGE
jgi:hypothetical protein